MENIHVVHVNLQINRRIFIYLHDRFHHSRIILSHRVSTIFYEKGLQGLEKYKSNYVLISSIDLVKHEHDIFSQNILDPTPKYGFSQSIS